MQKIAEEFAALLDQHRYEEAGELMAEGCTYSYHEGNYQGRANVVNMYRQMLKQALTVMTEYKTLTDVEQLSPNMFALCATDILQIGEHHHESRYDEVITIENGLVQSIEFRPIAGEAEKLHEFYRSARQR